MNGPWVFRKGAARLRPKIVYSLVDAYWALLVFALKTHGERRKAVHYKI